jgi:hypothetical protein
VIRINDDRLPELVEIEEPNRQQSRRITRRQTPCAKCRHVLTADDLCFANGQDAHRSCAELWNHTIFDAWDELIEQDRVADEKQAALIEQSARGMGLQLPSSQQESGLWTPPSKTPAAPAMA